MVNISGTIYHNYDKSALKGEKADGSVCYYGVDNVDAIVALYVKKFEFITDYDDSKLETSIPPVGSGCIFSDPAK